MLRINSAGNRSPAGGSQTSVERATPSRIGTRWSSISRYGWLIACSRRVGQWSRAGRSSEIPLEPLEDRLADDAAMNRTGVAGEDVTFRRNAEQLHVAP